eukprot:COSAG06_NODE_228_length_19725_cov_8.167839_12_plen_83_part_00
MSSNEALLYMVHALPMVLHWFCSTFSPYSVFFEPFFFFFFFFFFVAPACSPATSSTSSASGGAREILYVCTPLLPEEPQPVG